MKSPTNSLDALLEKNTQLAKRERDRAGLAEIASLLLQLRHELSLSQKELAARAGLSKTMISELENSANDGVTLRTLVKIARAAGASLNLGLHLDSETAGTVSTTLHTGRYAFSAARVARRTENRDLQELAA
jgi:transcriptional regulator with XRE-family HTH domain